MEIYTTKRKVALLVEGYIFYQYKKTETKSYFRCADYYKKCKVRVNREGAKCTFNCFEHNHSANAANIQCRQFSNDLKEESVKSSESSQRIVKKAYSEVDAELAEYLPSQKSSKKTIKRFKNKYNRRPAVPVLAKELVIPEEFKMSTRNQNFLLFDSGQKSKNRMIIFGTNDYVKLLQTHTEWYVGGTFKTCPSLFAQVYTIHIVYRNKSVPIIYALLPNKSKATYLSFFRKVKSFVDNAPTSVMLDFELAAIQALETVFPGALLRLCFFHLGKNLYKFI